MLNYVNSIFVIAFYCYINELANDEDSTDDSSDDDETPVDKKV